MEASGEAAQQLEADGAVADTVGKDWRALEKVRLRAKTITVRDWI